MQGGRRFAQPVAEQVAVERTEDQPLGPAGGSRNDADVLRTQAVLRDMAAGAGAGVKAEGGFQRVVLGGRRISG